MRASPTKRVSVILLLLVLAPLLLRLAIAQTSQKPIPGDPRPASVIIVCDASGSMLAKIKSAKAEVSRLIQDLRERQQFNVIFIAGPGPDDPLSAFSADMMVKASANNKESAERFVAGTLAAGDTEPIRALNLAFKQKPQVLYFLSDGIFGSNDTLIQAIQKANTDHATTISTVFFFNDEERKHHEKERCAKALQLIAAENGGKYKEINTDEE
jgi:Mg-chelatase subunit ChlD